MTTESPVSDAPVSMTASPLRLLTRGASLICVVAAVVAALFLGIPEENDYFNAMRFKHQRLVDLPSPRIVLIGGSNLAFGIDSDLLRSQTGCDVVNMGFNGYLGVRYMLAEAAPLLRPRDVVVVAFEYDNLVKSVDGTPADLLMAAKIRPAALRDMTWGQRRQVALLVPYAVQQKLFRLLRNLLYGAVQWLKGRDDEARDAETPVSIAAIETLSGFTASGDLVSHLDVPWTEPVEDGLDLSHTPVDPMFVREIRSFAAAMRARGVTPVVSFTAAARGFYTRHAAVIDRVHEDLRADSALVVPSPPSAFVFDDSLFFDTVYHLGRRGRALRTAQLARDLAAVPSALRACPHPVTTPNLQTR